ncbi:MAG: alpha/beta hydrolase [Thiotrichales bacterium]|nr:alpha/beta hydrolase [Thiotrichales bacterium]
MIISRLVQYTAVGLMAILMLGCSGSNGFKAHGEFVESHLINNPDLKTNFLQVDDFRLHYKDIGKAEKAIVVWVHGTPGNWTDGAYLTRSPEFLSEVKVVLVERPGWGASQFQAEPRSVTEFSEISRLMQPMLQRFKNEYPTVPIVLTGHSWGGSLVPSIALDHPDLVDGVLVLSGGLDPNLTKPRWYNKFAKTALGNAVIGKSLRKANVEMYALSPQLFILDQRWSELSQPIIVVQGDSDKLVNPKNADYAKSVLRADNSAVLTLAGQGHMLQLEQMDLVERCVFALVNQDLAQCAL